MNGFDLSTISNCYIGGTQASAIYKGNNLVWPTGPHDYSQDYFTIEALENSCQVRWKASSANLIKSISYSTDLSTWTTVNSSTSSNGTLMATLNTGDKLYLKGTEKRYASSAYHTRLWTNKKFNVYGNLNSLINGDNFTSTIDNPNSYETYTFVQLFSECPVIDASNLVFPFKLIKANMYYYMFNYCTQLETPPTSIWPKSDGTFLVRVDYNSCRYMFRECRKLTKSPIIYTYVKYDNDVQGTFEYMFSGCTALSEVTALCNYYSNMFNYWLPNAPATGTFTKLSTVTSWSSGSSGIPSGWTVVDVSPT